MKSVKAWVKIQVFSCLWKLRRVGANHTSTDREFQSGTATMEKAWLLVDDIRDSLAVSFCSIEDWEVQVG